MVEETAAVTDLPGPAFVEWLISREVRNQHLAGYHKRLWSEWAAGKSVPEKLVDAVCADRGLHINEIPDWVKSGWTAKAAEGLERRETSDGRLFWVCST